MATPIPPKQLHDSPDPRSIPELRQERRLREHGRGSRSSVWNTPPVEHQTKHESRRLMQKGGKPLEKRWASLSSLSGEGGKLKVLVCIKSTLTCCHKDHFSSSPLIKWSCSLFKVDYHVSEGPVKVHCAPPTGQGRQI